MFEGIVSDLLNRVLGTYIENLDCSKLKISIWGGNVELKDLVIKQSALDELQLPVRPVFGHLKRLCLKIPWSRLYTDRWEAAIEGLTLVVVPNASIVYDQKKEEQLQHEAKMATLARIEETKQRAKIKALGKEAKAQDGFMEKLIAQVIRNIQVQITNIHVRFEDAVTCSSVPFAAGFVLQTLSLQSTDANWKVGLDTAKLIYKLLTLEGFLLYWSPNARLLSHKDAEKERIGSVLSRLILEADSEYSLKPVLGPMNLTAKLQLNPRPEVDDAPFSIPKAFLDIVLLKLSFGVSRHQYEGMMSLLDSLDSLQTSSSFRRFRPNVGTIAGNSKLWWKYAYECKLEGIRRVRRNWSWSHIQGHRERCRRYKALYKLKLSGAKLNQNDANNLESCEKELDVFNITLVRKQAEMEQEREGLIKAETAGKQKKGWISGWFSWGSQETATTPDQQPTTNIVKQLKAEMNSEEKQKLFEAIGYSADGVPSEMPVDYIDIRLQFLLEELQVRVLDELLGDAAVCVASTRKVVCNMMKRSAASAVRIESSMQSFDVCGLSEGKDSNQPLLVESLHVSDGVPLLDVDFETNPLDGKCDTRVHVEAQPLNISFHSATTTQITNLFAPPKNVSLQQLQAAALTQLEVVKERSVTGLQSVIDNHSVLDLKVNIASSRLILPELGFFQPDTSMIVLTLGSVSVESEPRQGTKKSPNKALASGQSEHDVLERVRSSSYDCFTIRLKEVQVVVAEKGEDWLSALTSSEATPLHILQPLSLQVNLYKCLVTSDPNLPKVKVDATLPEIALSIIDKKIIQAAVIMTNCFKTESKTTTLLEEQQTLKEEIDLNQNVIRDEVALVRLEQGGINPVGEFQPTPQFTEAVVNFTIKEMVVEMLKADPGGGACVPLLKMGAQEMALRITQKTFDLHVDFSLVRISADYLEYGCETIIRPNIESSPKDQKLLTISLCQVNPKSPDIHSVHKSIVQRIDIHMARLTAKLEQAALLSLLSFTNNLQEKLADVAPEGKDKPLVERQKSQDPDKDKTNILSRQISKRCPKDKEEVAKKETFLSKFSAKLDQVELLISRQSHDLVALYVKGLSVSVVLENKDIEIFSRLEQFSLVDPDPRALYSKIVVMDGGHAWDAHINVYGGEQTDVSFFDVEKFDIGVKVEIGTPRIVFLNKTVVDLLSWINNFQAAKEAVVTASQAAAQAAKENISEAYSQGSKVKLDLVLKAPVIFVPHNSSSSQGILIDLGKILVWNKIELSDKRNELGHPAVLDKLCLDVQNVKISRKQRLSDAEETHLLQPLCLTVNVVRNLSISWFKALPEVEVNGRLRAVQMTLSEDDMGSVVAVLQGNLGEAPDPSIQTETQISQTQTLLSPQEQKDLMMEYGKVFKKLTVNFIVDDSTLTLFTSSSDKMSSRSSLREGFARFSLKGLTLKADVFSDMTIGANFILYDCILQDIREGYQEGITTMMEKKPDSGQRPLSGSMIDLTFHQGRKKDMFVDVKISEFLLVLHLPFLLRIQKFFTVQPPKDMADEEMNDDIARDIPPDGEDIPSDEEDIVAMDIVPSSSLKQVKGLRRTSSSDKDAGYEFMLTVHLNVEEPDIVLVDDLSKLDTSCIFLHAEIKSSVKMSATQRNITAIVDNIQMYTSVYNPTNRTESLSQILTKSSMTFLSSATSTHADNIQIKLGTLNFRLAPDTVELVMNIIGCLSSGEEPGDHSKDDFTCWQDLWDPKPLDFASLPHLGIEAAEEAGADSFGLATAADVGTETKALGGEALCLELECLLVTLEAGSGTLSIPLMKLQSDCVVTAQGFYSSQLTMNGQLTLEMAYYNPRQAIWEPLLEPVERVSNVNASMEHQPWMITFEGHMAMAEVGNGRIIKSPSLTSSCDLDMIELDIPPPLTKLALSAKDPLEFTVTKTLLEVLQVLSDSFMAAYKGKLSVRNIPKAPYKLINKTGLTISVELRESGLRVNPSGEDEVERLLVESEGEVDLFEATPRGYTHRRHSSLVTQCQIASEKMINIKLVSVGAECLIPVTKADKRYFSINPNGKFKEKLGLVTSVSVEGGCKVITLSGCVKVTNELDMPLQLYYMTEGGNEVEFVCTLQPKETFLLPLHAVYTPTAELFFSIKGYSVCIKPLVWRRLKSCPNLAQELHCQPRTSKTPEARPFLFCANCEVEQIIWGNTPRKTLDSVMMEVYLRPCVILNNLLPVDISLSPPGETCKKVMVPGASLHINHAQIGAMYLEIEIHDYDQSNWVCGKTIDVQPQEFTVWTFKRTGIESEVTLDLGMHIAKLNGVFHLSLYCPFWMVNKTTFDLTYKTDSLVHSIKHKGDAENVVLFSFRSKSFFGKKKANIRVRDSEWSEKFPLDAVGSAAAVSCRAASGSDFVFQVSIDIQLAGLGLTKIVTFSPFYKAINRCPYDLQYCLVGDVSYTWHKFQSGSCMGIWPPGQSKALKLRVLGTKKATEPIHFDAPHTTLFKLKNKYGGVFIEVSQTEGGTLVSADKCLQSASSAVVLNHLRTSSLALWQEGHEEKKTELGPHQMIHFTWDSAESRRLLMLGCLGCRPVTIALNADGKGVIEGGEAGWATWMGGAQRYLIVSEDHGMLQAPSVSNQLEMVKTELELSLNSIGLSLVNDIKRQEVLYLSMASSGVVWEHRKERGRKFRPFTEEQTQLLEKAFLMHSGELKTFKDNVQSHFVLKSTLEVDFALMKVLKPFERPIRRVFQPGVWAKMQMFSTEKNFHFKVNKLQLDNQMSSDVMFPVVMARVPPPKGILAETVPKSFFEMSVIMSQESPIYTRFKYLRVLLQEFHFKVELPFIYAILEVLFKEQNADLHYSVEKFDKDYAVAKQSLGSMVASQRQPSRRDFYHELHLSPIKMHLSFSLTGLDSGANVPIGGQVIHLFLQSVGVTLTEVQDVVFRLGFFERQNCWLNVEGFQGEVISHYTSQVMKQLYVLVLGLDVLGNPFGLVLGVTKGFGDLFYEPIQGAVEGPGEFAEGLFYGMRSFMGKTVGGAAGAFSRITGTIGKGVASLTLDEDYQRRRREEMHKKPADGLESFARGGRGVLAGVVDGVTGVFTKPISGAKEEGVEGFFKGVGKGVVGLVTRPASGMIDFASGSFDAVMRATDSSEEVTPVRPPRYIDSDGVIRAYEFRLASGSKLLKELEKGRYSETDVYVTHAVAKGRNVLLASDKRIFFVSKNDLLGNWKIEWIHIYDELAESPILCSSGIKLTVRQAKKKVLGVFGGGSNSKEIALNESSEERMILERICEAYLKARQTN